MVHYKRTDNKYKKWAIYFWPDQGTGEEYQFNYQDEFGVIAYYPLSTFQNATKIGFIVKEKGTWNKDVGADRFIYINQLTKDSNGAYHIYLKGGDAGVYKNDSCIGITNASFTSLRTIKVNCTAAIRGIEIRKDGKVLESTVEGLGTKAATVTLSEDGDVSSKYIVSATFDNDVIIKEEASVFTLYNDAFDEKYGFDGTLGADYTAEETTFRVWSPVSNTIKLRIYDNGTPKSVSSAKGDDTIAQEVEMTKDEKGVFSTTVTGDLAGKYYTYFVTNNFYPEGREIVDPYAKSAGVSGLRGMIVDFSKTDPEGWDDVDYLNIDRKHVTTYEAHVADITSSASWTGTEANRKRFLGTAETGTRLASDNTITTGFDHIKELGVNAVQFLPIFDQANDETKQEFNWGYNPLNYNVLEGSYSSDPYDGYCRIKEFKQVVKAYNEAGIEIIMDVVYNHVNGAGGSNFDVLMPGYYFRYDASGALYNGSGCGNETASDRKMYRKFMIDSTEFWMKEYKLGGFRFDLMGLHDVDTMNALAANLKTVNDKAVVYGEPWTGGTSGLASSKQAVQANAKKYEGYGQFNDQMRDALIKGGMNSSSAVGWITNDSSIAGNKSDIKNILRGLKGQTGIYTLDPEKTVNYVTCHDNYTLYDRFKKVKTSYTDDDCAKMNVLANAVVMMSQGTSFMLSGEEFLRTKGGNNNSYNSTYKVNELDYSLKAKHKDMFESYRKLIALKQKVSDLALTQDGITSSTTYKVEANSDNNVIHETLHDEKTNKTYEVYMANGTRAKSKAAYTVDTTGYTLYLDTLGKTISSGSVTLDAYETLILEK
jgi:pullulanase